MSFYNNFYNHNEIPRILNFCGKTFTSLSSEFCTENPYEDNFPIISFTQNLSAKNHYQRPGFILYIHFLMPLAFTHLCVYKETIIVAYNTHPNTKLLFFPSNLLEISLCVN